MNGEVVADPAPLFVINLCASTSPMALTHPNTPELKRYTFFVSRQREDGRERFRLHMGYFASQEAAEALLAAVRDVYPAAWAGPAPTTGVPRGARMTVAPTVTVSTPAAPRVARGAGCSYTSSAVATAAAAGGSRCGRRARRRRWSRPASLDTMSNVRDVLAQLSGGAARAMPRPRQPPRPPRSACQRRSSMTRRGCACSNPRRRR
jgi:hypothetical protein